MDVRVSPSMVAGTARAPPSKSYTHRALLAAGYSDRATVGSPLVSADTRATARAVTAFGGTVSPSLDAIDTGHESVDIAGFDGRPAVPDDVIDCANSGTTMRLVTGAAALADGDTVLTGDASLRSRPQGPLLDALSTLGVHARSTRSNGQAPLVVGGPLTGGEVSLPGDVSSQYVTALLMAGAVTDDGVEISLTTELKSAPYVDITLELLEAFGVTATPVGSETAAGASGFSVPGGQSYRPTDALYHTPVQLSSIPTFIAAGQLAADPSSPVLT